MVTHSEAYWRDEKRWWHEDDGGGGGGGGGGGDDDDDDDVQNVAREQFNIRCAIQVVC